MNAIPDDLRQFQHSLMNLGVETDILVPHVSQ